MFEALSSRVTGKALVTAVTLCGLKCTGKYSARRPSCGYGTDRLSLIPPKDRLHSSVSN